MPGVDVHAQVRRAELLRGAGRPRDAIALLEPLAGHASDVPAVMLALGMALQDAGDHGAALTAARAYGVLVADDARTYHLASLALTGLKRHEEAVAAARRSIDLDPHNGARHHALVLALVQGRLRPQQAVAAATRAVQLAPDEPNHHFGLGLAHLATGRGTARRHFLEALRLDPEHAGAHHALATERLGFGGRALAEAANGYATALAINPSAVHSRLAFLRIIHLLAYLTTALVLTGGYLAGQLTYHDRPIAGRIVAGCAALPPVLLALRFATHLAPHLRPVARRTARRQRVAIILEVVAVLLLPAAAVTPATYPLLAGAGAAALLAALCTALAGRRERRAEGLSARYTRRERLLVLGAVGWATLIVLAVPQVLLTPRGTYWIDGSDLLIPLTLGIVIAARATLHRRQRGR
jgi:tetratricopeptide (TPR) repeat protein